MNRHIRFITSTALLMALTIVFQTLGKALPLGPLGNFITGSFVNACLLVAVSASGLWSAALIGVVTPLIAALTNAAIPFIFVPFIAAANFSLTAAFYLLKGRGITAVILPALVKTLFLYLCLKLAFSLMAFPPEQAKLMMYLFGWPQFITALIGGILASLITAKLPAAAAARNKTAQ